MAQHNPTVRDHSLSGRATALFGREEYADLRAEQAVGGREQSPAENPPSPFHLFATTAWTTEDAADCRLTAVSGNQACQSCWIGLCSRV